MSNQAAQVLRVLGNQYRFQIVELLLDGEKNVTELNEWVEVSQPALSQHLSKLKRGNIVNFRRDKRQIYYSARNPELLKQIMQVAGQVIPKQA